MDADKKAVRSPDGGKDKTAVMVFWNAAAGPHEGYRQPQEESTPGLKFASFEAGSALYIRMH